MKREKFDADGWIGWFGDILSVPRPPITTIFHSSRPGRPTSRLTPGHSSFSSSANSRARSPASAYRCFRVLTGHGAAIDTSTANGRLVFGIFAALAEFERELIRERTQAGLAAARTRGRKGGRKFALTKAQVRLAQAAMQSRGTSVTKLAAELGTKPVALYRHVGPKGELREHGRQVLQA